MKKKRLYVSLGFIITTVVLYVVLTSYTYQLEVQSVKLQSEINDMQEKNDELSIEINVRNSRTSVENDYKNLGFNYNIYFLEDEK